MAKEFSVSGQHYLFKVQTFAQTILSEGGDEFHYRFYDRTTQGVIDDLVSERVSLGVIMRSKENEQGLDKTLEEAGLEFTELITSQPRISLPKSHPLVNAEVLSLEDMADYPYLYFHQGDDETPLYMYEEPFAKIPHAKTISCTDRASLSELIVALNGWTLTCGILVGISDGSSLTTKPVSENLELQMGYVVRKGSELSALDKKYLEKLKVNLERYSSNFA